MVFYNSANYFFPAIFSQKLASLLMQTSFCIHPLGALELSQKDIISGLDALSYKEKKGNVIGNEGSERRKRENGIKYNEENEHDVIK